MSSNIILKQRGIKGASSYLNTLSLHPLLAKIYALRGIDDASEIEFSLKNIQKYDSLAGIDTAVNLLYEHIIQKKNILVVGDFDADGATSTALMIRALRGLGIKQVNYLIPDRFNDGYGLSISVVKKAICEKTDLIITVDNGISAQEAVAFAKQHNIKVIITDHHLIPEVLPDADAIINPHLSYCKFPSKNLAGVGVAFYFIMALRSHLREKNWFANNQLPELNLANFLDLVALGTVADVVCLDANNRILVQQGINRIRNKHCCAGIQALLELMNKNQSQLSSQDLGFYIAPKINAAGRMENMSIGVELLLTDDLTEARDIATLLINLNDERKYVEQKMQQDANEFLASMASTLNELPNSFVIYHPDFHQGVIGILSSRIRDKFYRPVISFAEAEDNMLKGSGRSISSIHLRNVLEKMNDLSPDLIVSFGGHAMAAGVTIERSYLDEFTHLFQKVVESYIDDSSIFEHIVETDGILEEQYFDYEVAKLLKISAPWGQGFPEPIFEGEFFIHQQSIVADKHLKLIIQSINQDGVANGKLLNAIHFNADLKLWPDLSVKKIKIVYRLDPNEFRNNCTVSLLIEHIFIIE